MRQLPYVLESYKLQRLSFLFSGILELVIFNGQYRCSSLHAADHSYNSDKGCSVIFLLNFVCIYDLPHFSKSEIFWDMVNFSIYLWLYQFYVQLAKNASTNLRSKNASLTTEFGLNLNWMERMNHSSYLLGCYSLLLMFLYCESVYSYQSSSLMQLDKKVPN